MYSKLEMPPHVSHVVIKSAYRYRGWSCGHLACAEFHRNTWYVFNIETGVVEAIYHREPNQHGWVASEAHAKSHIGRASQINPFELDMVS